MRKDEDIRTTADAVRAHAAREAACPPPEQFLPAERSRLDAAEQARLNAHAAACPACAAEQRLARSFEEAAAAPRETASLDEAFVLRRLERGSPLRAQHTPSQRAVWGLAAAAGIALVAAALTLLPTSLPTPPPLPPAVPHGVTRGASLSVLTPLGDLALPPREFQWEDVAGAASFRVEVVDVEGKVVWGTSVTNSPAMLPPSEAGRILEAVVYTWKVEALNNEGMRVAWSEPAQFRVRPAGVPDAARPRGGGR